MNAMLRFVHAPFLAALVACTASADPLAESEASQTAEGGADAAGGSAEADAAAPPGDDAGGDAGDADLVDSRDGKTYRTVRLGGARWIAQNLDHEVPGSFCYDDDEASCRRDGRLYTWSAAAAACPAGWHLASDDDWKALESALGMPAAQLDLEGYSMPRGTTEGATLREPLGFRATLAGYRAGTTYDARDNRTYFWTSTTRGAEVWRRRITGVDDGVFRFTNPPASFAISVRCVED